MGGEAVEVYLVLSTASSEKEGKKIAQHLVKEGLAACVNVVPRISSFFFWEGKLCEEREVLILAKTEKGKMSKMIKNIRKMHSYAVPEILFLKVAGGNREYLQWVGKMAGKKNTKNY
jgi:periplasmic divalent cation tolerance protein